VEHHSTIEDKEISQLAVVPLAIPMTIGPGTTGILLLMGASFDDIPTFITGASALLCAVFVIGFMLYSSSLIEELVGKEGLQVISKITGLFLAALSAQIIFTGIKNFLGL
jgi:multiple antibiotic resistance protein